MNWISSLQELLPLLLVLSPVIGFLVTSAAVRAERELVRHFAVSNVFCSLLLFGGIAWSFERELTAEAAARTLPANADSNRDSTTAAQAALDRKVDKQRAERLSKKWFLIDGTNLWATAALILMTGVVVWQSHTESDLSCWFIPNVLLFEAASLGALTACDLRVFLVAFQIAVLMMSLILGQWGGSERRALAGRFFMSQLCGISFVMFGFAMLVVAVPWMKIEDSPTLPTIPWNIATIVYEIQKWTTNNQLAFQYANEVFPSVLFVLSIGFAIQFGLFPFHSTLIAVLSKAPRPISVLYLVGLSAVSCLGWVRFVLPLAPESLVGFAGMILIPSLGGAMWGSLRAIAADEPRQKAAFLFLSLSGVSLVGCYTFSRVGMMGGWLMQQQLIASLCLALLAIDSRPDTGDRGRAQQLSLISGYSTRTLFLMLAVPLLGFFASGFIICSELFPLSLIELLTVVVSCALVLLSILSLLNRHYSNEQSLAVTTKTATSKSLRTPLLCVILLAVIVNLFPSLLLRQVEPDFGRIFRRFERTSSASSAR